jgi:hypothetical protein
MVGKYTSAFARLRELPAVFTGRDLTLKFGWSTHMASSYLLQWKKAGMVRSLGGHSDVHMNLVRQPEQDIERALRLAYPRAVFIGADVLRQVGWTTQILTAPEVAVPAGSPLFGLEDFTLTTRPEGWFTRAAPAIQREGAGVGRLAPAWCLADMIQRAVDRRVKSAWLLAPDDIELDLARADPQMRTALHAFELDESCIEEDGYGAIFDELQARTFERPARERERG